MDILKLTQLTIVFGLFLKLEKQYYLNLHSDKTTGGIKVPESQRRRVDMKEVFSGWTWSYVDFNLSIL